MITISHNEIVVTFRKAFESIGFHLGQAEDASEAIGWLAVHGISPPSDLLARFSRLSAAKYSTKLANSELAQSTWDAQGDSGLSIFPDLADYAFVQALQTGKHHLTILNCGEIELIWPYALKIQQRGLNALIRWADGKRGERWVYLSGSTDTNQTCMYWLAKQSELPLGSIELVVSSQLILEDADVPVEYIRIENEETLQASYLHHIKEGIAIDENLWQKLVEIGKGLLVESTAESEKRGAGGV